MEVGFFLPYINTHLDMPCINRKLTILYTMKMVCVFLWDGELCVHEVFENTSKLFLARSKPTEFTYEAIFVGN